MTSARFRDVGLAVLVLAALLAVLVWQHHRSRPTNPLSGLYFWVDPHSAAAAQAATFQARGDAKDAALLRKLAAQPTATWLTDSSQATVDRARSVMASATASGSAPTFVLYNLPNRDCGGYSRGGAPSASAYKSWIRRIASALATGGGAVVIVEPDAIGFIVKGCHAATAAEDEAVLDDAVTTLAANRTLHVYLDAGNPGWVADPTTEAGALRASGIDHAAGFSLNVSNFFTTDATVLYGKALSDALHGKHFVIDTSRSGDGPLPPNAGYKGPVWCNPPGRALGPAPTTETKTHAVDAFLWIKTPGSSDGDCGLGQPRAGTFWPDYAVGLVQRANW